MADEDKFYNILIDLRARLDGAQQAEQALGRVGTKAFDVGEALRIGFGVDFAHRFVESIAEIPRTMDEILKKGFEWNNMVTNTERAVRAAALATGDAATSQGEAAAISREAMEQIEEGANLAGQKAKEMADAFVQVQPTALQAGIEIEKFPGFFNSAALAGANMNLQVTEIAANLRMMLEGHVGFRNVFAMNLGIDEKTLKQMKDAGELMDYLQAKFSKWQNPVQNLEAAENRLGNAFDKAAGQISSPVYDALAGTIDKVTTSINAMDVQPLEDLAREAVRFVEIGGDLAKWATEHTALMAMLIRGVLTFTGVISTAATVMGAKWLYNLVKSQFALEAETAAIATNTAALAANASARMADGGGIGFGFGGPAAAATRVMGSISVGVTAGMVLNQLIMAYADHLNEIADRWTSISRENDQHARSLDAQIRSMKTVNDLASTKKAIDDELTRLQDAQIDADTDGQTEMSNAYTNQISILQHKMDWINKEGDAMVAQNAALDAANEKLRLAGELSEKLVKTTEELNKLEFEKLSPAGQLLTLKTRLLLLRDDLAKAKNDAQHGRDQGDIAIAMAKIPALKLAIAEIQKSLGESQKSVDAIDGAKHEQDIKLDMLRAQASGDKAHEDGLKRQLDMEARVKELMDGEKISREQAVALAQQEMGFKQQIFAHEHELATQNYLLEYEIARARASGHEDAARALEGQKELRQQVMDIVEKTGKTEIEAANYVLRLYNLKRAAELRNPEDHSAAAKELGERGLRGAQSLEKNAHEAMWHGPQLDAVAKASQAVQAKPTDDNLAKLEAALQALLKAVGNSNAELRNSILGLGRDVDALRNGRALPSQTPSVASLISQSPTPAAAIGARLPGATVTSTIGAAGSTPSTSTTPQQATAAVGNEIRAGSDENAQSISSLVPILKAGNEQIMRSIQTLEDQVKHNRAGS